MGRFLHHEACPSCGSRDNLAVYDDGGKWCFGCHYTERATRYVPKSDVKKQYEKVPRLSHEFSQECISWVSQYGLSLEELLRRGCGWNDERQQLVFTFPMSDVWQARNFRPGSKSKYWNQGDINELIPIYDSGHNDGRLCLVEDCISAIKIARQCDAMPILGSHVSLGKLVVLSKRYNTLIFWLDSDKYKEAQKQAAAAAMLGINVKVIYTDEDPKCYSNEAISENLR